MDELETLIEAFLTEAVALTKGSQRVMNNAGLVADLADAVRDDAQTSPQFFPAGASRSFRKISDEEVAHWFLETLDNIEKSGYEGTVYSRDGVNSDWITRRYIAGSHSMEDIDGILNMNLRDFYLLKNRGMLDAKHSDIPKYNSIRDLGAYITTHFREPLAQARDASKNAARNKMAKSVKLVDNDDYRIYTTLNRAAGCLLGLGTQWCTANSQSGTNYHTYSDRAMLFQVFPYKKVEQDGKWVHQLDKDGKKVLDPDNKFQFDAGGMSFMDQNDNPVSAKVIAEKFPHLYDDLSSALKSKKEEMEQAFDKLSAAPDMQNPDYKIKTYKIDQELEKLKKFLDRGHFTNKLRPKPKPEVEPGENPQLPAPNQAVMEWLDRFNRLY